MNRGLFTTIIFTSLVALLFVVPHASAQDKKSQSTTAIKAGTAAPGGGVYGRSSRRTLISQGSLTMESKADTLAQDSLSMEAIAADSLAQDENQQSLALLNGATHAMDSDEVEVERARFFSDSMSLSKVTWAAAVLPGFGQVYNKQYWKLPVFYSALGGSIMLFVNENKKYQPLKSEYDALTLTNPLRTDEVNSLQNELIKSSTRRQVYMGAMIASYIYTIGDAAVNYSTNDTSDIKRATTLATIFPGAGQVYNESYWKVPIVVGGFAMLAYVLDWNNRGYQRFKKAYSLRADYDTNPDLYPDGSADEFGGRYSASYLLSLRDSYRRNRDMSYIFIAGLYILQIIDAHVDAHFKDFDVSDDLSMNIEPMLGYSYSPSTQRDCATYGFSIGINF